MDDTDDCKRPRTYDEEKMLRQFITGDGPKGNSVKYKRGWEHSFKFTNKQREATAKAMELGLTFDEAFDLVAEGRDSGAEHIEVKGERITIRKPTPVENFGGPADLLYFPKKR